MLSKWLVIVFLIVAIVCFNCEDKENIDPQNEPENKIANNSFEKGTSGQNPENWLSISDSNDEDADFLIEGGYNSNYGLKHSKNQAYKIYTYQVVPDLESGYYSLTAWVKNSGGQQACYLSVKTDNEEKITSLPVSSQWVQVIIRGIPISNSGTCTIGLLSDANASNWCLIDNLQIYKDDQPYNFLKGGDLSQLSYIEQMGGKFFENGTEKDCFEILKNNGMNLVRLRLYNDPGNPNFTPSKQLPAGIQNPEDILALAQRAKNLGMQIQLTFHYSDYWTNGGLQTKPHDWALLSYDDLKKAVYDFTFDFMTDMKEQGTTPEFVSLGNEIAGGILFPDGASSNFTKLTELLNKGYEAVKAVSPETKVVIHLDDAGNSDKYDWFFGELNAKGAKYDIIGASYYPFWTRKTVSQMVTWANYTTNKFDKNILIMETGYNWNPVLPDGFAGQLSNNGPYDNIYPSTKEGQRNFLYECFNGIKMANGGRVIGDIYWDPVMIEVPGVGWELGGRNVVANTTLFDFNGNALPSLKAYKFNN